MKEDNPGGLYEFPNSEGCLSDKELEDLALTSPDGHEIPIYNSTGGRVPRRKIIVDKNQPPCGVLVDLSNIQELFHPDDIIDLSDDFSDSYDSHLINIDAYPLAFLRTAGNLQADGIPPCFYPSLTEINNNVRKNHPIANLNHPLADSDSKMGGDGGSHHGSANDYDSDLDIDDDDTTPSHLQAVKPIFSQFYNHITHRVASQAGKHDSQQGTVTVAISGAFANTEKDKTTASKKLEYCNISLPSERFHDRISSLDVECPTACRAEFVYSIDLRALKDPSGRYVRSFSFRSFYLIQFPCFPPPYPSQIHM